MRIERRYGLTRVLRRGAVALLFPGVLVGCLAQPFPIVFNDFSLPEYYAPPHETQLKSLLQGEQASPQDEGKVLIKKPILKTFREDGSGGFVMHAEDCLYDPKARDVSSAGPLQLETANGQFFTEGSGFLWQADVATLTISNRVHTRITQDRTGATEP